MPSPREAQIPLLLLALPCSSDGPTQRPSPEEHYAEASSSFHRTDASSSTNARDDPGARDNNVRAALGPEDLRCGCHDDEGRGRDGELEER
jgi:hypothetical protein